MVFSAINGEVKLINSNTYLVLFSRGKFLCSSLNILFSRGKALCREYLILFSRGNAFEDPWLVLFNCEWFQMYSCKLWDTCRLCMLSIWGMQLRIFGQTHPASLWGRTCLWQGIFKFWVLNLINFGASKTAYILAVSTWVLFFHLYVFFNLIRRAHTSEERTSRNLSE